MVFYSAALARLRFFTCCLLTLSSALTFSEASSTGPCFSSDDCTGEKIKEFSTKLDCEETHGGKSWSNPNTDECEKIEGGGGAGGDPHFTTWHGRYFSYHGKCDLVLVSNPLFCSGLGIDIHVRTEQTRDYSLITNVALRIGDHVLEVVNDGTYFIDNVRNTQMPAALGPYAVTKKTNFKCIDTSDVLCTAYDIDLLADGDIQIREWRKFLFVDVSGKFKGSVGLMGTWDKPGMIGRDGIVDFEREDDFGGEWQVLENEPKLFQEVRAPQHPQPCVPLPSTVRRRLGEGHQERKKAENACKNVTNAKVAFCIFDVMMTGDVDMAAVYM